MNASKTHAKNEEEGPHPGKEAKKGTQCLQQTDDQQSPQLKDLFVRDPASFPLFHASSHFPFPLLQTLTSCTVLQIYRIAYVDGMLTLCTGGNTEFIRL
jgi:hypothetical protein